MALEPDWVIASKIERKIDCRDLPERSPYYMHPHIKVKKKKQKQNNPIKFSIVS